ncbi:hypothetical protein [Pseudoalteromonas marina]|uniref:Uncharacterized protein n=1 Tax=Pseudoalteromonas marina TaxID=267375 RepID=A0ABT9FCI1_9GAMM|nr:hypothetical protein [Pseudoalteromonas marina]MDP2564487.1 hypothetical protein [Pseudoalteromonas marina]
MKNVNFLVTRDMELSFYLELAKNQALGVEHMLFLVDLGLDEVSYALIARGDVPGFIQYRMACNGSVNVCRVLAGETKVKAVLHLLARSGDDEVRKEVKGNGFASSVTLKDI